jgi:hypothetical protein
MGLESAAEHAPAPHEQLRTKARLRLAELFPDAKTAIGDFRKETSVNAFLGDVLSNAGIEGAAVFHQLDADRQRELLADRDLDSLFENLSPDLLASYRNQLGSTQGDIDPMTDPAIEGM